MDKLELHSIVPDGTTDDSLLEYMVIAARHGGKWVIVRLKGRTDWCFPGGHREKGETMDEAARRELYEETGARVYSGLSRIAQYSVDHGNRISWGTIYKAEIAEFDPLPPEFEIEEMDFVEEFPLDNTRFPGIMPGLMDWLNKRLLPLESWQGPLLTYSFLRDDDIPDIAAILAKHEVCRWMFFGPNSPEVTESYFSPLAEEIAVKLKQGLRPDSAVFTLRDRSSGEFAGQCALLPIDFSPGAWLIGYQLDDTVWGRGFGREAGRFLCHYGMNILKAHRISGDCVAGNRASEKIMLSLGFKKEGRQKELWHHDGRFYDNLLFGLTYSDLSRKELSALGRDFSPVEKQAQNTDQGFRTG